MDFNYIKTICESNNFDLSEVANEIEMTLNGFRESIRNETIQLKKIKTLCKKLNISPLMLFEEKIISLTPVNSNEKASIIIESKEKEIEYLKQRINDKDEIIRLLRQVNSRNYYDGNIAAEPK